MKHNKLFIILFCFIIWGCSITSLNKNLFAANTANTKPSITYLILAKNVFKRVINAYGLIGKYTPRLKIDSDTDQIFARVFEDGTISISEKAVVFCYSGVSEDIGNSRFAFVVAHEIAHLANCDFDRINQMQSYSNPSNAIRTYIRNQMEFLADRNALIYSAIAGYQISYLRNNSGHFIKQWVNLTGHTGIGHPPPAQRIDLLMKQIAEVAKRIRHFDIAVRLYQIGQYTESLRFFESFRKYFPCHAVLNNIALIHYQKAMMELKKKDACKFKLSLKLNTYSCAHQNLKRQENKEFIDNIDNAKKIFSEALIKDKKHIPSIINYTSALIIEAIESKEPSHGNYSIAKGLLMNAKNIEPDNLLIQNNLVIATYLASNSSSDDYTATIADMEKLSKNDKSFATAYYNLGRLQLIHKNNTNALAYQEAWKKYITLEPNGPYAEMVRNELKIPKPKNTKPGFLVNNGSLEPGRANQKQIEYLNTIQSQLIDMGKIYFYYQTNELNALSIGTLSKWILFVEYPGNNVKFQYNLTKTANVFKKPSGVTTYVYDSFACDVDGGTIVKKIFF
ncbi:TPR repeat-containing protein [Candidatus Magnetomorum sp. HK-1]|nr:TPR repeat-containing protein [Candidatus Magnetomorum sp. HK-1]